MKGDRVGTGNRVAGHSLWVGLVLAMIGAGASAPALGAPLLSPSPAPSREVRADGPEVVRRRFVTLNAQQTVREPVLELNLFPDRVILADRQRTETILGSGRIWIGRPRGGEGTVTLAAVGDVLVGEIRFGDELFEIRYAGEGIHTVYRIDARSYAQWDLPDDAVSIPPEDGPATLEKPIGAGGSTDAGIASDPCNLIDILVLYTPAAEASAGGTPAMEALIYLAVAETNNSFRVSGVTPRLNLVHLARVTYTETGNLRTDRDRLKSPSDGYMDIAHTLRDRYCADVTSLIVDVGNGCGVGFVQDPAPQASFETSAFNVVVDSCATGNFSFGHELGHIMGARHDWYVDDTTTPFSYSHGFVNVTQRWRTVMAYNNRCKDAGSSCTRLGRWSNAGLTVGGNATGVAAGTSTSCAAGNTNNPDCDAENYLALNNTACTVANFRDRGTCSDRNDVWMKDTWTDTGAEPDPLTASESMWKSRAIWVRNNIDANHVFQHQHQNPVAGKTNFVYVKIANDFSTSASGSLKLYYAAAATGLSWPTDWTLFSSQTVNIPVGRTLIAEASWVPPAQGHYCLLARWDAPTSPSDPMTFTEGANVELNTRNNNNIVWRNVNVKKIDSGASSDTAPVTVRNVGEGAGTVDLIVRLGDTPRNFLRSGGEVILDLGTLYDLWQQGGAQGSGILDLGPPRVQILDTPTGIAEILNLSMGQREEADVFFSLTAPLVYRTSIIGPDGDQVNDDRYCSTPGFSIPDNDPAGVTDEMFISSCVPIDDLDLSLKSGHTYVGDLRYTLTHVGGPMVVPLDRPGMPQSAFGCAGDDIDVLLDDDALSAAEEACGAAAPSISGVLLPGDPPDERLFEAFRGEDLCGTWELNVTDNAAGDTGTLDEWCLVAGPEPVAQRPVTDYMLDLVQRDAGTGDEVGGVGYDIVVSPEGPVGAVPDGGGRPGVPLTVGKTGDGRLLLTWGASCIGAGAMDTDYIIYEGSLASIGDHSPERCTTEGLQQATVSPSSGNTYYLVVPRDTTAEGSHGLDSAGAERVPGAQTCLPQVPGGC